MGREKVQADIIGNGYKKPAASLLEPAKVDNRRNKRDKLDKREMRKGVY